MQGGTCEWSVDTSSSNWLPNTEVLSATASLWTDLTWLTLRGVLFNNFCVMSSLRKGSAKQALACACPILRRPALRCVEGTTPVGSQESTPITGFSSGLRGKWPEDELCPADKR